MNTDTANPAPEYIENTPNTHHRDQLNENVLKVMSATHAVYVLHKLLNQATSNGMGGLRPLALTVDERDGLMVITGNACMCLREAVGGLCDLYEQMGGEILEQGQEDGHHA